MRPDDRARETRWKFAVSTSCCINMPLLAMLQGFRDAGVRAVELGTPPRHFDPWRHDQIVELSHRLREFRLAAVAVHAPFGGLLDLTDPNPHHRHAAIGAILSAASALRELGGRRTVVHLSDAARMASTLEERLDPRHFVRVHRAAIVNLQEVKELDARDGGATLVMSDGARVAVSRSRRRRVEELLLLRQR